MVAVETLPVPHPLAGVARVSQDHRNRRDRPVAAELGGRCAVGVVRGRIRDTTIVEIPHEAFYVAAGLPLERTATHHGRVRGSTSKG